MLMGQRLCKELALVDATWPAAFMASPESDPKWPQMDMQVLVVM